MPDAIGLWRRWWRLPRAEKSIASSLAWRLLLVDVSLRLIGLKRTRRRLLRGLAPPQAGSCSAGDLEKAQRLAALASVVGGRGLGPRSCLRQALVVEQWLRRRGLPAELKIGVRKHAAMGIDAHAWVELNGVALAQPLLRHNPVLGVGERFG